MNCNAVAFVIGAVLWPFVSVYLRETTGSFVAAFLLIPIILLTLAAIIWFLQSGTRPQAITARMADVGRALGSASIGLAIQTVRPGCWSSRRHRHLFQEEILVVMAGSGTLHHGDERLSVGPSDCICYLPGDPEAHAFENTGAEDLVIWAFGNRFRHEVCVYPDQGVAFVEGLGADVPLDRVIPSEWTEELRKRCHFQA